MCPYCWTSVFLPSGTYLTELDGVRGTSRAAARGAATIAVSIGIDARDRSGRTARTRFNGKWNVEIVTGRRVEVVRVSISVDGELGQGRPSGCRRSAVLAARGAPTRRTHASRIAASAAPDTTTPTAIQRHDLAGSRDERETTCGSAVLRGHRVERRIHLIGAVVEDIYGRC